VKRAIQVILEEFLPETIYGRMAFAQTVDIAYQHFFELAQQGRGVAA
jgi:hypothetical protein